MYVLFRKTKTFDKKIEIVVPKMYRFFNVPKSDNEWKYTSSLYKCQLMNFKYVKFIVLDGSFFQLVDNLALKHFIVDGQLACSYYNAFL